MALWNGSRRVYRVSIFVCVLIHLSFVARECHSRVCSGTRNALSTQSRTDITVHWTSYANCTVINYNVEVAFYRGNHTDTSFLDTIEEVKGYVLFVGNNFENITMKSLKVIRGHYKFDGHSLFVEGNANLKRLSFPSLKEIVGGSVLIENNPQLCFVDKIKWSDILYDPTKSLITLHESIGECKSCSPACHESCWSEDDCQQLRRGHCSSGCKTGCLENEPDQCCHDECVVGCSGKTDNCLFCRNFNNSGRCVETCSQSDGVTGKKLHYASQCVDRCPDSTVQHQDSCITSCPDGYKEVNNTCKLCNEDSNCPKICEVEDEFTKENLHKYVNCSIIKGHFQILNSLKVDDLKPHLHQFSQITEITGFLIVQGLGEGIDDLSFLKNLRIIRGQRVKMSGNSALNVMMTKLKSLNLPRLERIENDRIVIFKNERLESLQLPRLTYVHGDATRAFNVKQNLQLCYVTNQTFHDLSDPRKQIAFSSNKDEKLCEQEGKRCHEECSGGCWGPGNNQCRFCKNFYYRGECLPSCGEHPNLYAEGEECKECHPQCNGCHGEGATNCTQCSRVKDGDTCLERCPADKFPEAERNTCQYCHGFCKDGCTGPLATMGRSGCNNCHLLAFTPGECMDGTLDCGPGRYESAKKMKVLDVSGRELEDLVKICSDCHPQCKTCSGDDTSTRSCECLNVEYKGACIDQCPNQHFEASSSSSNNNNSSNSNSSSKTCRPCHTECDSCFGGQTDECFICKNARVYVSDLSDADTKKAEGLKIRNPKNNSPEAMEDQEITEETNEKFKCVDVCPDHIPYYSETVVEDKASGRTTPQRICRDKPQEGSLESRKRASKVVVGSSIFGVFCVLLIVAVILGVLRIQKAKSEAIKCKLEEKIERLNEEEPQILSPTTARPDLSSLRLIKESELEKWEEIGSGAFGTVYRGIWHPEGEKVRVAVAIKILTEESSSAQHKELLEEARVMASVGHPCCIRILAVCLGRQMMLVTPLVAHGSLLSYLRKKGSHLSSFVLLNWAAQVARGMAYLEQKAIVHRDLAARNILVQSLDQIKITDFGLAKLLGVDEEQFLATGGKLPVKWMALESIQHRVFTHKSDVWSYGITLWELFTCGRRPYENISAVDMADHLEMGERLPQPPICTMDVYMIMRKCWEIESERRPTFQDLDETFVAMSRDPDRFIIVEANMSLLASDFIEDNRTGLIRQLNLTDEEDFICGEDYLCPTSQPMDDFHPFSKKSTYAKDPKFAHLEAALQAEKTNPFDRYNAEPGSIARPKHPTLDEVDIKLIEQKARKENREDYLEPEHGSKYVDMKSPAVQGAPSTHQPTFGLRGFSSDPEAGRDGVTVVKSTKIDK